MAWVPLECNPEVMTKFMHKVGVPNKWSLVDVYSLEPELLTMLPKPVVAIILLYPVNLKSETYKLELELKEKESGAVNDKVYHLVQYVPNSCGTVALIHCIANNLNHIELKDGDFKKFLDETKGMNSSERGEKLVEAGDISSTHEECAQEGQTEAPSEEDKILYHYVAFVETEGFLYELDGRKPYPINHGPSSSVTFLEDAAKACQEYLKRDPDEVHFNLMALTIEE